MGRDGGERSGVALFCFQTDINVYSSETWRKRLYYTIFLKFLLQKVNIYDPVDKPGSFCINK